MPLCPQKDIEQEEERDQDERAAESHRPPAVLNFAQYKIACLSVCLSQGRQFAQSVCMCVCVSVCLLLCCLFAG